VKLRATATSLSSCCRKRAPTPCAVSASSNPSEASRQRNRAETTSRNRCVRYVGSAFRTVTSSLRRRLDVQRSVSRPSHPSRGPASPLRPLHWRTCNTDRLSCASASRDHASNASGPPGHSRRVLAVRSSPSVEANPQAALLPPGLQDASAQPLGRRYWSGVPSSCASAASISSVRTSDRGDRHTKPVRFP